MRLLLALFAVLALALSPLSIAAAQAECAGDMAPMAMGMAMDHGEPTKPPCSPHSEKACAAACATMAGAVATLAASLLVCEPASTNVHMAASEILAARSLAPSAQDRPPKPNA